MCGRFTIMYSWAEYYESLNLIPSKAKGRNDPPRFNVTPGQTFGSVVNGEDGLDVVETNWGFIPFWASKKMKKPINARGETVHTNGMFKQAFKSKRCLIPASSYYEWIEAEPGNKLPYNIHLKDNEPFFFAGIWATNKTFDATTCAIITLSATENIEEIHGRMPVILNRDVCEEWIDRETEVDRAVDILQDNRGRDLQAYRVGKAVNKNDAQGAELIAPI